MIFLKTGRFPTKTTDTDIHLNGRVSKVLVVTSFCSGSDGVIVQSERLLYLAQLEVEESLVPVEVEAEVLSLAPLVLSVGQEHGALSRPSRLLIAEFSTADVEDSKEELLWH